MPSPHLVHSWHNSWCQIRGLTILKRQSKVFRMSFFAKNITKFFRNNHWRSSIKKVFLEILQNSQENTCATASFSIKLQALVLQLYLKRDFGTGVLLWILQSFPVNCTKFLRTLFFTEHLWVTTSDFSSFSKQLFLELLLMFTTS